MNWSDDELMAYADGELEPAARSEIETAMATDAPLRERVAALRSQRERVRAAYAPVLDEPLPDRLAALLGEPAPAPAVASLDAARAARSARRAPTSWAQWGGIAAAIMLGVLVGVSVPRDAADGAAIAQQADGRLVAGGALALALSRQLARAPAADSPVAVQLSFVDRDGRYCRTFTSSAIAGLACRQGETWALQTIVAAAERTASGAMRPAASPLPRALLDAVDERIDGAALDAGAEQQARDRGWRR